MMLLIDAGNTRVKWALADDGAAPGAWSATGAVAHAGLDALASDWAGATRVLVSNVAGPTLAERSAQASPTAIASRRGSGATASPPPSARARWRPART
jgi:type III pantothenate kinase